MARYQSFEDLADALVAVGGEPNICLSDRYANLWVAWESEGGDWYATRPRNIDDDPGPGDDRWRPIGPVQLEELPLPCHSVDRFDAALNQQVRGGESA